MDSLPAKVTSALEQHVVRVLPRRLLLAVSGGLDSMVLLSVLHGWAERSGWHLEVAHFNHQLRGTSGLADARLVEHTCEALKVRCTVGSEKVREHAKKTGMSLEMAARELRHRFLADVAVRRRCPVLVTAHHANDQAELVLMRLLRGSGSEGLAGMSSAGRSPADKRVRIVRPMLGVFRREIAEYATVQGIEYREDSSNRSRAHLRNSVRHDLLPRLRRDFLPSVDATLCRVAEILREESEYVEGEARDWLKRRRSRFETLPRAVQRRVVLAQAKRLGAELTFDAVHKLVVNPDVAVNVAGGRLMIRRRDGRLEWSAPRDSAFETGRRRISLVGKAGWAEFGGLTIEWSKESMLRWRKPSLHPGREVFDAVAVGRDIVLRHWQPGDRFQPIGMNEAVKLQDLFTNLKVPMEDRRHLVVGVSAAGSIFWVQGLRIGERFKLRPETRRRLVWRWKGG